MSHLPQRHNAHQHSGHVAPRGVGNASRPSHCDWILAFASRRTVSCHAGVVVCLFLWRLLTNTLSLSISLVFLKMGRLLDGHVC